MRTTRRSVIREFASFAAGSPLVAETTPPVQDPSIVSEQAGTIAPPEYSADIMAPVNLHEIEQAAKKKLNQLAYDHIAGGAADELTLQANREAFGRFWLRRRVMNDVSTIDTKLTLLGQELEHPILLAPAGAKPLLHPDGDRVCAHAAKHTGAIYVVNASETMAEMSATGTAPIWWSATLGHATPAEAHDYAKRSEDEGASALCVSVDYPYTGSRDRNARNQFDLDSIRTGEFSTGEPPRDAFQVGMLQAYTPSMTWEYLSWLHGATGLPVVVKGIVTGEDAELAVDNGANVVIVSNHGGRTLDGMSGTLDVLAEVSDAVNGRVPVLVDGGIRRGGDVLKAIALGANAVLIGRPYLWGLGAFGQQGVQRVVELLHGELRVAMAMAGMANLADVDRHLVQPAWEPERA
jgi:isopentenyl diphosphate isomerase/L-lactate dehydrogenase-like FMN-dependent dehydrogenase